MDAEVIVAMNGCEEIAVDYIRSLGRRFRFIWTDKRIGAVTALNLAAQISDGEYIIKMDDDVEILDWGGNNSWINLLTEPFLQDNKMGQTGAFLESSWGGYYVLVGWMTMIPRRIWDEVGGLDTIFNPGNGDDIDLSIKIQKAGYKAVSNPPMLPNREDVNLAKIAFPAFHKSFREYALMRYEDSVAVNNYELELRNYRILWERYGGPVHQEAMLRLGKYLSKFIY
jgi:glycosyltransferase involved in cell wall biosynthesis